MDQRVGATFGKYTITGVVGKGGMGEVYEAYDNQIGRTVALKIIKSQFANDRQYRARFERESHAAATLQEPHVIPIHGFGEIDGSLFIDMRLVRGKDLEGLLANGPLEPARAVAIVAQIAAALDAAHAEGLVHRDVKPQNILVTPADFAYLVDFGIAETMGEHTRLTAANMRVGSWAYMAPERFSDRDITPAADIYSLACVLYEALTGQLPFPAQTQGGFVAAHLSSPPPRPSLANPRVPAALDDVIARGMAKEPDDRYGSAGAFGRAAERALRSGVRTAVDPTDESPTRPASWPPAPPPQPPTVQQVYPQTFPPYGPPSGPQPVVPSEAPARPPRRWLAPAVIGVSAVLVLGGIGVAVGLLAKKEDTPAASTATVPPTIPPYSGETSSNSPEPIPSRPTNAAPPLVTGPDQSASHQSCDQGFQMNVSGYGSHGGRGSPQTSCYFANAVLHAYWNTYNNATNGARTVSSPGAVDCFTVAGANCDPKTPANFLMQCAGDGANPWIRCTGGKDAVVYLW
ncbi:MAG: serine/threonine protein kinase [Mycobacterium sp.]|uniref:non-specific serine/threonine protein kinase n=1 Tax=Mycobacterium gordonae TaxID=1778 RepID=A0A1A6BBK3_MYCGO|nr:MULTISPECIES: serine/threonine-protein kinase [Mycobacterium]MBI2698311.1 protein kinase [Mycobacterium sp.]MCQ4361557.1 protein kinase [Mycobacterium gordonae]OBR99618.1 serine/threonine protein kinase [Mycobacterium gordonae]PJE12203.1 MAG: serine/threonine protein kinase [Mycobacterium sp.]PJE17720.1 MAG: serine/threonine protein kinase [Mycobacterium sp.]